MILPSKYIEPKYSLFFMGAILLKKIGNNKYDIIDLWYSIKKEHSIMTYNRYIQTLIYLFTIGSINYTKRGEIYNENIKS